MSTRNRNLGLAAILQSLTQQLISLLGFQQLAKYKLSLYTERRKFHIQQLYLGILVFAVVAVCHEPVQAQNSPAIGVSPNSLVFAADQGGANPATQTLNISNIGGADLTWTASKAAPWLTLNPITGNAAVPVTATVVTGSLAPGTYNDEIIVAIAGTQAAKIPVRFVVTSNVGPPVPTSTKEQEEKFRIPSSANSEWRKFCVDKSLNLNGDFQSGRTIFGWIEGQWSVGPAISTQLIKYDMAKKQAGFNASVGAGASFRFYRPIKIKKDENDLDPEKIFVGEVRTECRQTSFGWDRKSYRASPLFSITPTLYATKPTNEGDLAVQPAVLFGFFEDVLNFGVGFNLTGPPEEKGHVFLLMSIGTGFNF